MLILRRKKNESILIGEHIRLTVIETAADGVRLAIDAPKQISILREELSHAEEENRSALATDTNTILSLQSNLLQSLSQSLSGASGVGQAEQEQTGEESGTAAAIEGAESAAEDAGESSEAKGDPAVGTP